MDILYRSTRSNAAPITASKAILQGLSPDGGLFVPETMPVFDKPFSELAEMSYQDLAYEVMSKFFTDFSEEELRTCIENAYDSKFDTEKIAPLVKKDGVYFLELFHGRTIAFKDMALSILPHFITMAAKKNGVKNKILILTATSGDTGKAAMAGFADVPGTKIMVFFPDGGVSNIQRLQMVTADLAANGYQFSSANSINIGRLVPQIVYYVYAYCTLLKEGEIKEGDKINITVPTGNFGNILAAYYGKLMGLPVGKLICASNDNKVLFDFFRTGEYDRKRKFILTSSPSMDILISSNLERLIYRICGNDPEKNRALMESLTGNGSYTITDEMRRELSDFYAGYASEEENFAGIRELYEKTGYVIDTHTGIGNAVYRRYREETGDTTPTVIASTASPFKFAGSVMRAIAPQELPGKNDFELIDTLAKLSGTKEPYAITDIRTAPVRHKTVVDAEEMPGTVRNFLGI